MNDLACRSIFEQFAQIVQHHGERYALVHGDQRMTYNELDAASNRLANWLLSQVSTERYPVALLLANGIPLVVALLGVLRSGCAASVIEISAPPDRQRMVIEDLGCSVILTEQSLTVHAQSIAGGARSVLDIAAAVHFPTGSPGVSITPDDLALIIYTSGSTGTPKGIERSHGYYVARAAVDIPYHETTPDDVISLITSLSYASALQNFFTAILAGATVCIYDLKKAGASGLRDWIVEHGVTQLHLPNVALKVLLESLPEGFMLPSLRCIRPSQRLLSRDVKALWSHVRGDAFLVHGLSASEAGRISRLKVYRDTVLDSEVVPVGYPLPGVTIALMDEDGSPVPIGETGEIWVSGPYLSERYWRQPSLTVKSFVVDACDTSKRKYRTGDLGRLREDGCLEIVGRIDNQVKIRGYRVEMEAVEAALEGLTGVSRAALVATSYHNEQKRMIAYVETEKTGTLTADKLRAGLLQVVPDYMIPSRFVILDAMPTLPNGKVDYRGLPPPGKSRADLDTPFVAPANELEQQVADIWAELLDLDEVGVDDDFFELGGDSILAMRMVIAAEQRLGRTAPLRFLRQPTIANMVGLLSEEADDSVAPAQVATKAFAPTWRQSPPVHLRGRLRSLAGRLERRILEWPMNMPFEEGMAWLRRWAGQPLLQNFRYAKRRRLFREFAATFDSPAADDRHAFAEAILNDICGQYIRQIGRRLPATEYITALQSSRWPFWQDLGNQFAASLRDPATPAPFEIVGTEILQNAARQHKGVILVAPHLPMLGTYKAILASLGIFPHPMTGESFEQARADLTSSEESLPAEPVRRVQRSHELLRARQLLEQDQVIYIPIDAASGAGPRLFTPVGKRLFPFNIGAIELALATGAPLLPITTLLQPDNRLRLTIFAPLATGDPQTKHDERLWITAQACGAFLASLWRLAPFARTWGDMGHFLAVSRTPAQASPGQWIDFDKEKNGHA